MTEFPKISGIYFIQDLSENSPPKKSQRSSNASNQSGVMMGAACGDFEEDLSPQEIERFECTICFNWLNEPLLTDCGHKFCKSCLENWLKNGHGCPTCNNNNPEFFPDNFTRREILSIRKSCKFRIQGCKVRLSPLELEKHMQECEFNHNHHRFECHYKSIGCTFSTNENEALLEHIDQDYKEHLDLLLSKFSKNQFDHWEPKKNGNSRNSSTETDLIQSMFERIVVLEQKNRELSIKLENMETHNARRKFCNGTLIWRIENFRNKVDLMRANPTLMYYSCEAFTSPEGYRFCARINLSQKRDTLSLHIHLMKSDNDYHLEWPFFGRLKISMIHPTDFKESQHDTIMSKPEVQAFHRPAQEISNRGFGFIEYAYINDIFKRGFISDDSVLTFKVQMNIV